MQRVVDERRGTGRGRGGKSSGAKKIGIHRYRLVQPTDVNENKELPPSSDFLSPSFNWQTGWSWHVRSRKHNSGRNEKKERERERKKKRAGWIRVPLSVVVAPTVNAREKENRRNRRIPWRLFRRVRERHREARARRRRGEITLATGAIISLPRNGSFVKAKRPVPRCAAPRRDAAAPAMFEAAQRRGGCISVIRELE